MPQKTLTLHGFIKDVSYQAQLTSPLEKYDFVNFDVNQAATSGLILYEQHQLAFSKWVSPKRTRSYPFERLYNTLNAPKIATIIPIIKDEGKDGDLDKIQYATFSWMNLLNVYVVLAYYASAEKNQSSAQAQKHKITNQQYDAAFVREQLREIMHYRQSALHWNRTLLENRFTTTFERALDAYSTVSLKTGVQLHAQKPLERYLSSIQADFATFKSLSQSASEGASQREVHTIHAGEFLQTTTKAKLVIRNYLGGQYFLTADEILFEEQKNRTCIVLQESKNTNTALLPSLSDIKDGLFKLVLYSNLDSLLLENVPYDFTARLYLSGTCKGSLALHAASEQEFEEFFHRNSKLTSSQQSLLHSLQREAQSNDIEIVVHSNKRGMNE